MSSYLTQFIIPLTLLQPPVKVEAPAPQVAEPAKPPATPGQQAQPGPPPGTDQPTPGASEPAGTAAPAGPAPTALPPSTQQPAPPEPTPTPTTPEGPAKSAPGPIDSIQQPASPPPGPQPTDQPDTRPKRKVYTHDDRHLALGISVLAEHSFGGVIRARTRHIGIEGGYGVRPYLLIISGNLCEEVMLDATQHATASVLGFFGSQRVNHGVRATGAYDKLAGWGGGAGYHLEVPFTKRVALGAGAGLKVFPRAEAGVAARFREACDFLPADDFGTLQQQQIAIDEAIPPLVRFQFYVGASLLIYLF